MLRCCLTVLALIVALPVHATPANCPSSHLAQQRLTITTSSGRHRYKVEVAASPDEQECGLMFRRSMAADHGMIFPSPEARQQSFWMENTYLPLDIIFVGADGRIVNVAAGAVPLSRAILSSRGPAATVIELNAGEAARIGLQPGDRAQMR